MTVPPGHSASTPALVLGGDPAGLGALRALGRRGIPVYTVVEATDRLLRRSRFYRPLPGLNDAEQTPRRLSAILAATPISAVLIPCSDHWAAAVSALEPALATRFPSAVASPEALRSLQDKAAFAVLLETLGVAHPATFLLDGPSGLDRVPETALTSAFLKPCDSQRFNARFGLKAFWVTSRDQATQRLHQANALGLPMLLQSYVPGGADHHYFIDGFRDRSGALPGLFARRRLRMFPPDFGNSSALISVPLSDVAPALDSLRRVLEGVNYRGIFSAEFKFDEAGHCFRLLEINTRPWLFVDFAARCGVDVVTMAYQDSLGLPVRPVDGYRIGAQAFTPIFDLHALRAQHASLRGLGGWVLAFATHHQPIASFDDPLPAMSHAWSTLRSIVSNRARRIATMRTSP